MLLLGVIFPMSKRNSKVLCKLTLLLYMISLDTRSLKVFCFLDVRVYSIYSSVLICVQIKYAYNLNISAFTLHHCKIVRHFDSNSINRFTSTTIGMDFIHAHVLERYFNNTQQQSI